MSALTATAAAVSAALPADRAAVLLRRTTASGDEVELPAPATGTVVTAARTSTPTDVRDAVERARAAQRGWVARPVADRARVLLRVHDLLVDRRDEVIDIVQVVTGKSRRDALLEVLAVVQIARYFGLRGPGLLAPRRRPGVFPVLVGGMVRRRPVGVIGSIAAWNYPLLFLLGDSLPALLAGNAVLTKPAEVSTPLAGLAAELLADAGLPEAVFAVLVGDDPQVPGTLIGHVDHVLFTGSTRVGRLVSAQAGELLTSATLELGGKNPLYVAADADLDRAAVEIAADCFGSTGQTCTSTERLYVHADVAEPFLERLVARARALRLGWTRDYSTDVGSLVSPAHAATVLGLIREAVAGGAQVRTGGRARPDLGPSFVEPTVLTDVPPGAACLTEEIFGPVVVVQTVRSDAEAVARMNDTDPGIMAAVWAGDRRRAQRLAARVAAGTVLVNASYPMAWASVGLPIGGIGSSGVGRRYGREGLAEVTRAHVVLAQRGRLASRFVGADGQQLATVLPAAARLLRGLRLP